MDALKATDPRLLGDVRIHARLGQGGMGRVYYGITRDDEPVAIKVILSGAIATSGVRARFEREVEALRMAQSPRVAGLVDAAPPGEEPPWLAMDYVRGLTLQAYVYRHGPLTAGQAAALAVSVAEGLRDVHTAGLRHRDLKPNNIMLGEHGPMIIDLGLVSVADAAPLTESGATPGTAVCMAPEQINTPQAITEAIDWYALGAVLVYATTRHFPYDGNTQFSLLQAVTAEGVRPDLSGVPDPLLGPISALLAYDPKQRPGYGELVERLAAIPPVPTTEFAQMTYVAGEDPPGKPVPPPQPHRVITRSGIRPAVQPTIRRVAAHLRGAYARGAAL